MQIDRYVMKCIVNSVNLAFIIDSFFNVFVLDEEIMIYKQFFNYVWILFSIYLSIAHVGVFCVAV